MNVLVVEDERLILMMLSRLITDLGHTVVAGLSSAEAALDFLEQRRVDFVLLDIRLEGAMDGVDAGTVIHQKWRIPFAYATAYTDKNTQDRAKATDPIAVLSKPLHREDLKTLFEKLSA
jgi:CheY-like chemotaxis protein